MNDIRIHVENARQAFDSPTLRLLTSQEPALTASLLRSVFGDKQEAAKTETVHSLLDSDLAALRESGVPGVPNSSGRLLGRKWVELGLLVRDRDSDGDEVYSLTVSALRALTFLASQTRERSLIGESRVASIMNAARDLAARANPDRSRYLARLDERIAELQVERERVATGGHLAEITDSEMMDGADNLLELIRDLPEEFAKVVASVKRMHRTAVSELRADARPQNEIASAYIDGDNRLKLTPEGRAFESAIEVLRADGPLARLREDVSIILDHPTAEVVELHERRALGDLQGTLNRGISLVRQEHHRLDATFSHYLRTHDVARDQEVARVLQEVDIALATWTRTSGPRSVVGVEVIPGSVELTWWRERMFDPLSDRPVAELELVRNEPRPQASLAELLSWGGPMTERVMAHFRTAFEDGALTVAEAFAHLPATLARPVEVLGLLAQARNLGAYDPTAGLEPVLAIRPDGSTRAFLIPRIELTEDGLKTLDVATELAS